jgi:hypothetical protein
VGGFSVVYIHRERLKLNMNHRYVPVVTRHRKNRYHQGGYSSGPAVVLNRNVSRRGGGKTGCDWIAMRERGGRIRKTWNIEH